VISDHCEGGGLMNPKQGAFAKSNLSGLCFFLALKGIELTLQSRPSFLPFILQFTTKMVA
jgi:hypothetical protein